MPHQRKLYPLALILLLASAGCIEPSDDDDDFMDTTAGETTMSPEFATEKVCVPPLGTPRPTKPTPEPTQPQKATVPPGGSISPQPLPPCRPPAPPAG